MDIKSLAALPQFKITSILHEENDYILYGTFDHLTGIRGDQGWLYKTNSWKDSYYVTIKELGRAIGSVTLLLYDSDYIADLQIGMVLPYIDGYWQPRDIAIILDEKMRWDKILFKSSDAEYYNLNGIVGWTPAGGSLPEGAASAGIKKNAWDHEHCNYCNEIIGEKHLPYGYKNDGNIWVCESCFLKYVQPHDFSFM